MNLRTTLVIEHGLPSRTDQNPASRINKVLEGDAIEHAEQLAQLQHTFGVEFDHGTLTVERLRAVLCATHWLSVIRPAAQRASDLLAVASERAFEPGGQACRDCKVVSRIMASVATHDLQAMSAPEAARKIRIPADFYSQPVQPRRAGQAEPPIRRSSEIHPDALANMRRFINTCHGSGLGSPGSAVRQAGQIDDDALLRVYLFAYEMHCLLERIHVKVGGLRVVLQHGLVPTPEMQAKADRTMTDLQQLLDKIAGRDPLQADPDFVTSTAAMVAEAAEYQEAQARADAIAELAEDQLVLAGRIESHQRGLMALADYLGESCTKRVRSAMDQLA